MEAMTPYERQRQENIASQIICIQDHLRAMAPHAFDVTQGYRTFRRGEFLSPTDKITHNEIHFADILLK